MAKTMIPSGRIRHMCWRRPGPVVVIAAVARICGMCAGFLTLLLWLLHVCKSTTVYLRVNWNHPLEDINLMTWRMALFTFNPRFFGRFWGGCCMGLFSVGMQIKYMHTRFLTKSWMRFSIWNLVQMLFVNIGFCGGLGLAVAALSFFISLLACIVHFAYPRLPVSWNLDLMPSLPHTTTHPQSSMPVSLPSCPVSSSQKSTQKRKRRKEAKDLMIQKKSKNNMLPTSAQQVEENASSGCHIQHSEQQTQQHSIEGSTHNNTQEQQQEHSASREQLDDDSQLLQDLQQRVSQQQDKVIEYPLEEKQQDSAARALEEQQKGKREGLLQEAQGKMQHDEDIINKVSNRENLLETAAAGAERSGLDTSPERSTQPEQKTSVREVPAEGDIVANDVHAPVDKVIHEKDAAVHAVPAAGAAPSAIPDVSDAAVADPKADSVSDRHAIVENPPRPLTTYTCIAAAAQGRGEVDAVDGKDSENVLLPVVQHSAPIVVECEKQPLTSAAAAAAASSVEKR